MVVGAGSERKLPSHCFPNGSWRVLQQEDEHCHGGKLWAHVWTHILAVFCRGLTSNESIVFINFQRISDQVLIAHNTKFPCRLTKYRAFITLAQWMSCLGCDEPDWPCLTYHLFAAVYSEFITSHNPMKKRFLFMMFEQHCLSTFVGISS